MGATRRNRVSDKNWGEIVRAYEVATEDYLHVANALGMNRSMRRSIIALYIREGRMNQRTRGGRNHVKIDDKKNCLEGMINENCLLTLNQINEELRREKQTTCPFLKPWMGCV